MARSTRSSGKAAGAKARATAAKKKKAPTTSPPGVASVSKKSATTLNSSSSKKAPAIRRGGKSSLASKATTTTNSTKKSPATSKRQKNRGKATATKASKPPSSPIKPPTSRRPLLPLAAAATSSSAPSLSFPPPRRFLVGTALSVYQNSGGPNTNWSVFEKTRAWGGIRPAILGNTRCGLSSGFWDGHFDADAELAKSVGSNCLRLSLEWSRIVPKPGVVDRGAIARYRDIFDSVEKRGMEVLITLHHFVHPAWFDDVCGGFESDEGLRHFVEWSKIAFDAFGHRIASWCTFNEPGVFASSGYCTGFFPPGKLLRLQTAGEVLLRMLRSHTAAVKEMRRMSAEMHSRNGGKANSEGGKGGAGTTPNAKSKAPPPPSSAAAPGARVPRHSFGIVHNVMPYEAKPYFGVSPGLDLAEDAASVEQGFHSGMTVEAEREFEESQKKKRRKQKKEATRSATAATPAPPPTPPPSSPVPFPPPSRDPSRGWSPPWSRAAAALGHAQWGNDVVLRYLSTGVFEWDPLGGCLPPPLMRAARLLLGERRIARLDRIKEPELPPLDWFGLNFYGRVVLDWKLSPTCYAGEIMGDFGQGVWPAGFKAVIRRAGRELGVPVIVTETGIPDGADAIRAEWADLYLGALEELLEEEGEEGEGERGEARREGGGRRGGGGGGGGGGKEQQGGAAAAVDLRGVCYWSLIDSFEWAFGYSWFTKFGLFGWDYKQGPEGERRRRPSAGRVAEWFGRLARAAERSWHRRGLEFEAAFPEGGGRETKKAPSAAAAAAGAPATAATVSRGKKRPAAVSVAAAASVAAAGRQRRR